jgi:hypothetical protein
MTELLIGILIFYGATVGLLSVWFACRRQSNSRAIMTTLWLVLLAALATAGAVAWDRRGECSRFGAALLMSSPLWGSGPFLIWSAKKDWHAGWSVAVALVAPYLSLLVCLAVLLATGLAWGP